MTTAREGKALGHKAARYAHARQFKLMRRTINRQRTIIGRLQREMDREATAIKTAIGAAMRESLSETLSNARRIGDQSGQHKAVDGQRKLYAWHAPEVDVSTKGPHVLRAWVVRALTRPALPVVWARI